MAASEEDRQRFKIEAQAAAALNHPNITHVYAIEEFDDEMFIVMEYIDGKELKDRIEKAPLAIQDTLAIALQIAGGLQAAHDKGVTHRDIKSANIMFTAKGDVKIMDFGLAKVRGGAKLTLEQSTLGTAPYMSPEQARGEDVDHRTDIFSLGVLLYEMVSGQLPFKGDYEQALVYSIMNEDPEPLTGLR
ncbi:MAG: serine/threonine-protein kinase, partial [Calditrichaeota bacterium]|nr:serine/threonine-protein kinase [Calditrichota bacterium]